MSISGLKFSQRHIARERAVQAAMLGFHHASELHYTEGSQRWEGIDQKLIAAHGKFPKHADCSSFVTWCLWNGLEVPFKTGDLVNGTDWHSGWTGTMAEHGREVHHVNRAIRGDAVLYGANSPYLHTAIIVGHQNGTPMVVSNGSENGPYLLPYNYRGDVGQIRRYI